VNLPAIEAPLSHKQKDYYWLYMLGDEL